MPGWRSRNARTTPGSTRTETLWKVPTRTLPAAPVASARRSASAASSWATTRRAWRRRRSPASVGTTGRRPVGRTRRRVPAARSRAAICRLTADCV